MNLIKHVLQTQLDEADFNILIQRFLLVSCLHKNYKMLFWNKISMNYYQ